MLDLANINHMSTSLSDQSFERLGGFITERYGIKMPPVKRTLLEARLRKRLRNLKMNTFEEYCDFLFSEKGMKEELQCMVDVVTTNKTDFFREDRHFSFLAKNVLPAYIEQTKPCRVWSSACSSGEEPYTLAMVLEEFALENQGFDYSIMATDLSSEMIVHAHRGIYKEEKIAAVPQGLRKKYIMAGKGNLKGFVRVSPALRAKVRLKILNLMDKRYDIHESMDVVFCRNVLIYFDRSIQEQIINRLAMCIDPDGYLFLGHSETLTNLDTPFKHVAPSVYKMK